MTTTTPAPDFDMTAPPTRRHLRLSLTEVRELIDRVMPDSGLWVREVDADRVVVVASVEILECRPGGTLSGAAIFKACDLSAFIAVNVYAGPVVTGVLVQASIDLLEATEPGPLEIAVDLVQLGRRMAVVTTRATDQHGTLVAVATMRFSLPFRQVDSLPTR